MNLIIFYDHHKQQFITVPTLHFKIKINKLTRINDLIMMRTNYRMQIWEDSVDRKTPPEKSSQFFLK